jgi:hypothetical protein
MILAGTVKMETRTFRGVDEADIEAKIWDWQTAHSVCDVRRGALERLPLRVRSPFPRRQLLPEDQYSMLVYYSDRPAGNAANPVSPATARP